MVFLNGIGSSLEIAEPLARQFRNRPFVALEMPGAGQTPLSPFPLAPASLARIAVRCLEQAGLRRFILMGLSLGGALAQQIAIQYRGRVDRLILAGTCSGTTMLPADWTEASLWRTLNPFAALMDDLISDLANAHVRGVAMANTPAMLAQFAPFMGWSSLCFLPMIEAQTLVLAGSRDRIIPPKNAVQLSAFIRRADHRILPDAGHLFPFTEPERTASHIERFLQPGRTVD
ncbi:alpha/beta fold hydrolase [Henriciella pelagia]|uniref:alpha/beta fold hydrolase n=1 Tax=Henriciella pelagia TaxID=1977912 RepID=UPI002279D607|nr:alpha/beta fold hydrolase [Henriciella pelagia]